MAAARTRCTYLCFAFGGATAMAYCTYPPGTGLASWEAWVTARAHCTYLTLVWLLEELGCCQGTLYLPNTSLLIKELDCSQGTQNLLNTGQNSWGAWLLPGHTVPTWQWSGLLRRFLLHRPGTSLASWGAWLLPGNTLPTWHWSGFLRSLAAAKEHFTYLTLVWLIEELGCCQGTLYVPDTGLVSWGAWLLPGLT